MSPLKRTLQEDMKTCMRAGEKERLLTIRLILAAIKQREVDERIELDDNHVLAILDKLAKQRRESITQFGKAKRQDLVDKETAELQLIESYLPTQLTEAEIEQFIKEAIKTSEANSMQDMGKVMGILKPKLQGRADMSAVSAKIRTLLS